MRNIVEEGHGLLRSLHGFVTLRVLHHVPPTVPMLLGQVFVDETEGEVGVITDVIRLDALAEHWRRQSP